MPTHHELLTFACTLADRAREVIRGYYRLPRSDLRIEVKGDHSPIVTIADQVTEQRLREMVHSHWPEHGIVGEEFPTVNPDARYLWVFDPIDGTVAFSMGKPTFGTLIALFEDNEPILGIIDQPILAERWVGLVGHKTTLNGAPMTVMPARGLEAASLAINGLEQLIGSKEEHGRIRQLSGKFHVFCYGGDCYNYGLLASGYIDAVIEASPDLCDFAAVIPIIRGAGGHITGWRGERLTRSYTGGIVATSANWIHDSVLELINDRTEIAKK